MPLYHPNRFNFSVDWEQNGYFNIKGKYYYFNPTVRDFFMILRASETDDLEIVNYVFNRHNIIFESIEEYKCFFDYCFSDLQSSRFPVNDLIEDKDEAIKFDYFIDSDVIYTDFVKNYPLLVQTPNDLAKMNYWQFKMLFNNLTQTISQRVEVRGKKIPKRSIKESMEQTEQRHKLTQAIREAKLAIKIEKTLKFK